MKSLSLPYRGATNNTAFIRQQGDAAPLERLRNARVRVGPNGRQQFGTRPAIDRLTARPLGDGEIQGMVKVTRRAGISGYAMGDCDHMGDVFSGPTGVLAGNLAFLDSVPSMSAFLDLSVVGDGGPTTTPPKYEAISPDDLTRAVVLEYAVGGVTRIQIRVYERNLNLRWQVTLSSPSVDRRAGFLLVTNEYVMVGVNYAADPTASISRVRAYGINDGVLVQETRLRGWPGRFVGAGRYTVGTTEYVHIAFDGTTIGDGGEMPIIDGTPASMFQSGFMQCRVGPRSGGVALIEVPYTTPLDPSSVFHDIRGHGYWRLAEWSSQLGYGRWISSISVAPDGTTFLTTTSHGYGPTFSYPPDGQVLAPVNVFAVNRDGTVLYEASTDPVIEIGLGGFYNDIPTSAIDLPSLIAGCVAPDRTFFCGGRYAQGGYSAFGIGVDGIGLWRTQLMSSTTVVRCAAIDPSSGYPIFGGDRHTSWPGASGANAHLWMLAPTTGLPAWAWDLNTATTARSVAVGPSGNIVYGVDRF